VSDTNFNFGQNFQKLLRGVRHRATCLAGDEALCVTQSGVGGEWFELERLGCESDRQGGPV